MFDAILEQTYAGEELYQCADKYFYFRGSFVHMLTDEGVSLPFYDNGDIKIDAITVIESAHYILLAYKRLATAYIDVISAETRSRVHTYQLPADVTFVARMAVSADSQILAFVTALPREILYVMRLNYMDTALISAQLDLTGYRSTIAFSPDTAANPSLLDPSHPSSWLGMSFCPQGNALICISRAMALLVTFHFIAHFCYLVARPVGINLRSPVRARTPAEFIAMNYIRTLSVEDIRGTRLTGRASGLMQGTEDGQAQPEDGVAIEHDPDERLVKGTCVVAKHYGGSGLPMGKISPQRIASPDGDWTIHAEEDICAVLHNVYGQTTEAVEKLAEAAELLPLVAPYCDLEHNIGTSPTDFSPNAFFVNTKFASHFYLIDKVLDDENDETEAYLLLERGPKTTDAYRTVSRLMDTHILNPQHIARIFHLTGSHFWIPKQPICLLTCANLGVVAVAVPDFELINSAEVRKTLAAGLFVFPPAPKTAFLNLDYSTNDKAFDLRVWAKAPDSMLGLADGVSSKYQATRVHFPNVPLNHWYLGNRRLTSISASLYLTAKSNPLDIYNEFRETSQRQSTGETTDSAAGGEVANSADYSVNVLLVCGFADSTVKWFHLPLSSDAADTDRAEPGAHRCKSIEALPPIYSHTYAALGPVRYLLTTRLADKSVYYYKTSALYNTVCLCLFTEALAYLPTHAVLDNLSDSRVAAEAQAADNQDQDDTDDTDDDEESATRSSSKYGVILPSTPAVLYGIVPSLAYRGENLRANHFRSLTNIRIMAALETNRSSLSRNAYRLILYALSKYNSGCFVETNSRRQMRDQAVLAGPLKGGLMDSTAKDTTYTSNFFIGISDYIPLVTVCKPIASPAYAINAVRKCIASLSFVVSMLPHVKEAGNRGKGFVKQADNRGAARVESLVHCTFIGTLDCGRLYMLCADEHKRVHSHYFSCRVPMTIMDSSWHVPDPISAIVALPESKFVITGHVSGYVRMFSCGFTTVDALPLSKRMFINLVFRIKASDLPITHLAVSPSSTHLVAIDTADNMFLLAGPQHEFALYGFLQLKSQPHLTPQYASQSEADPMATGGMGAGVAPTGPAAAATILGYARASLNFQSYIVEKFSEFILSGASISALLRRIDDVYECLEHTGNSNSDDYGLSLMFAEREALKVDVLNPALPAGTIIPPADTQDITRDMHKASQHLMTVYEGAQAYTVPIRRYSLITDVLSQNSNNDDGNNDTEDDTALRQALAVLCNNLRPTYNPFLDDFIPLVFNSVTDVALTDTCIYVAFSTGDVLRLNYPQMNAASIRAELNSVVLQNDYEDALNSHSDRDLENTYLRFTRAITDNLLLSYSALHPYIIRTGYAIKSIGVDPMCIPPPCSLSDILYVGLEDGRLFCYISKHDIDQTMLSRMSQYIQDVPLAGHASGSGSSGMPGICQMRGPITSLSVLHDLGIMAVTDATGLTLVMQLCQVTSTYLKRVINQARDLNDMSGPSSTSSQSAMVILPTQNDMHVPAPHVYGMPVSMTPTTYYYVSSASGATITSFSGLYSNSLLQNTNTAVTDANGATIAYFSEPAEPYCVLLTGTSVGSVTLCPVQASLVSAARQYVSTIDAIVKQFLQVQTTQENMTISGFGSKAYITWKTAIEQRARARAAVITVGDYQLIMKAYESLLTSVSDSERIVDGCLWMHQTSLAPPLYTHHPMVMTLECDEIIAGTKPYQRVADAPDAVADHDASGLDRAIQAVQEAIRQMQSRIDTVICPSYQDLSLRFAAQVCAIRFNSRSKLKKIGRLISEVQKLRESCRELEADNDRILADHELDVIYQHSDLRSLTGLQRAKQDLRLSASEVPSLVAVQSRLVNKERQAAILSRIDSIKSFKASIQELETAVDSLQSDDLASDTGIDVPKLLRATARVPENAFRISEDVTLLARAYLLKHMVKVEQYMKATILRSMSYLHMLESQLIHTSRQDEIGYAVCGLADPKVCVTSFSIPRASSNIMIKARKVCLLRSAQIVSERYSIYAPHVGLPRATQNADGDERSYHNKFAANRTVFGNSVLLPPHKSIFTRLMTSRELPFDETGTLLDFSAALSYTPKTYYYKAKDPFFLEDNRVQIVAEEGKDGQEAAETHCDLPESQTLFSLLQLSTGVFDRAPQIPFAQIAAGESLGFVYPRLPTADVIGSHEAVSLRRALFTEAECAFAIRAKQQIFVLRAIALLLVMDFNNKLAEERDKKFKLQSRIHDIANQIKDNSKELVYFAKEATLLELIEAERKKIFSDMQSQGIGVEDAASRAAKQAVLGLPSEDVIAQRAIENVDIQLLDINTITGYSPGGGDAGIDACESIAIMLGYNPYLQKKQSGNDKSYSDVLAESLRKLAGQCTIEKTFQTVAEFLHQLHSTKLVELGKSGTSATDIQQAQLNSVSLLNFGLRFYTVSSNPVVNAAILTLTDEGLFKVEHLKTLMHNLREQDKTRNTVSNKEVLRLWYSYKRALYDMMRGAIDAANRITVRDIPIPTVYGLDKVPGMKLTKEQEQELDAYNTKIKDLVDKRMKEKRQLEASCKSLREQATQLSLQFDNDRLHTLRKIRFNAEIKLQAIQLAIGSLNMRLLDRAKTLRATHNLSRYEGQLSSETRALGNSELIAHSILNRLQKRLVTLRSAEKLYNAGIKRELQDPHLLKYLKQRSNPKVTRNALRQYFTTKPDLDTAIRELLNTGSSKHQNMAGTIGSSTFSTSAMSAAVLGQTGSTSSQSTSIPFETIQTVNGNIMELADQQAVAASQQRQALLIESEEQAVRWLAQTHSMIAHHDEDDFRDLMFETALAESLYFDSRNIPTEIPNLMSLPATENPVMVSLIHKVIPLHGLPAITQLLSQVSASNHELRIFDIARCTKLALELQIYETTRLLQETQASVSKLKSEGTLFTGRLERHHSDTLALSRKTNAEFVNVPLLILVKEGQVEPSRTWDMAVDRRPLVFGGIRVGIDLEKTQTRFMQRSHKPGDEYDELELDADWDDERDSGGNNDDDDVESILLQDSSSFIVLNSSYVDELNERIRALGERRSVVLMNLARFRQQTKIIQHRIDLLDWQRKDAIAQTKDYQLIRVSKEMYELLRENSSTTEKRSREVSSVQRKLEHTRKSNILANNQLENKINAIPLELQAIEQQNIAIEARINELRAKNIQRRQAIPETELNEVEIDSKTEADKKFRRIAALRKMKELSRAQEEELQFLMRELEKLRRRTYPSFD